MLLIVTYDGIVRQTNITRMSSDRALLREMEMLPIDVAKEPPTRIPPPLEQVMVYSTQMFDDKSQILRIARIAPNEGIPGAAFAISVWFDPNIPARKFLSPLELGFRVTTYDEITKRYQPLTDNGEEVVSWKKELQEPPPIHPDFPQSLRVWRFIIPLPQDVVFTHERVLMVELNNLTNYLYKGKHQGLTFRLELVPTQWSKAVNMYCQLAVGTNTFLEQYYPIGIYDGDKRSINRCTVVCRSQWMKRYTSIPTNDTDLRNARSIEWHYAQHSTSRDGSEDEDPELVVDHHGDTTDNKLSEDDNSGDSGNDLDVVW